VARGSWCLAQRAARRLYSSRRTSRPKPIVGGGLRCVDCVQRSDAPPLGRNNEDDGNSQSGLVRLGSVYTRDLPAFREPAMVLGFRHRRCAVGTVDLVLAGQEAAR
jgi:hypothetical protein